MVSITTQSSDLVAVLTPGDSLVTLEAPLVLDASCSYDPDLLTGGLGQCDQDPNRDYFYLFQFTSDDSSDGILYSWEGSEPSSTVDTTIFNTETTYYVYLQVSEVDKEGNVVKTASTSSVIQFSTEVVPLVTLTASAAKANVEDIVYIYGEAELPAVETVFSSDQEVIWIWTVTPYLNLMASGVLLSDPNAATLILAGGSSLLHSSLHPH